MIKDLEELKNFLLWAKANGLVSLKVDTIEVTFGSDNRLPKEAQGIVDNYWKSLSNPKADEMSLENEMLFAAVK